MKVILVLRSVHDVLAAEKRLQEAGMAFELIPTPTSISSDCGMVIECDDADLDAVRSELGAAGCVIEQEITGRT